MTEDEKYTDISDKLKKLPRLKASDDFMTKLESRIAQEESERSSVKKRQYAEENYGILDKISMWVRNPWLAPVMGILIFAFIALYVTQFNKHETFNDTKQEINQMDNNSGKQNPELNKNPEEKPSDLNPSSVESNSPKDNSALKQSAKQPDESELNPPVSVKPESRISDKKEISKESPVEVIPEKSSFIKDGDVKGVDKDNASQKKETEEEIKSGVMRSKSTAPETSAEEQSGRSSEESQEKFEKPIGKNIMEKLNAMNKKNLDSLKKKINKQ